MIESMQMPIARTTPKISAQQTEKNLSIVDKNQQQTVAEDDFGFDDFLDIFNPLQHIPIVSRVYKEQANDPIENSSKAIGDVFYGVLTGGILGVLGAVANAVLKQQTDKGMSEHLFAYVDEEYDFKSTPSSDKNTPDMAPTSAPVIAQTIADSTFTTNEVNKQGTGSNTISKNQETEDYWSVRMKQLFEEDYFV
ncbi:MAG: hypothetical protein QM479_16320 [Pseudomonadota bacterium]